MNDEQRVNQYDEAFSLMADEIGIIDTKIMGVYGAMHRGATKEEALRKYDLSEKVYDENIDRVIWTLYPAPEYKRQMIEI